MAGFKLNANGDIDIDSNGHMLLLQTKQELVRQRLEIKLRTWRGEYWLDTSFGIPYRDNGDGKAIIGKGYTQKDVDALYIAAIREDEDVNSIEYFNSEYNPVSRDYSLKFEVKVDDEILSSYGRTLQAWQEETYTYNTSVITSSCDINFSDWVIELHPTVHEDLPDALQPPYTWG